MKGNVFNIQKFSIHDGPGVRTTVFLKGCPLRCEWCANPESQQEETQITYEIKKCMGCQTCIQVCSNHAITYNNGIQIHDTCRKCLSCVSNCPTKALKVEGEMMDVKQVVDVCLQDIDFYEESGGGVTLSGGECLVQPAFCKELIHQLKQHNIHVAAETTGYIEEEIFHQYAPLFDLLLFDVKHYDSNQHKMGTKVNNELIIKNLTWAHEHGINILPRVPVIPGFNATLEDAKGISNLLKKIGIMDVQLLPFHQFGERKYELLHRAYSYKDVKALYKEDLLDYQKVFLDQGLNCWF